MKTLTHLTLAVVVGLGLAAQVMADVPRDAGSKAHGEIYNFWVPKSSQSHAQDHARSLYYYGRTQQPLSAPPAQQHVKAIRQNLSTCQQGLGEMKKANPDNKEAQTAITKIEVIHTKVLEQCDMLDKECCKEKCDSTLVCDCCAGVHHDLKTADSEMDKLQKALKIEELPMPAKHEAKN